MKFITSSNLRNLRALEYNQTIMNIVVYLKTLDLETLKLKAVWEALQAMVLRLDATLVNAQGSLLTTTLNFLDEQRDRVVRAFRSAVKAKMNSTVEARAEAATKLFFIFEKFGNIAILSHEQETSAIRQLLSELNEAENKALLELLHLEDWLEELQEVNEKYSQTYIERTLELGEKQTLDVSDARLLTQEAFENLCILIEAGIITDGEAAYSDLVAFINNEVAQAKLSSRRRVLMKRKGNEEVDPLNPTPATEPKS